MFFNYKFLLSYFKVTNIILCLLVKKCQRDHFVNFFDSMVDFEIKHVILK